MENYFNEKNCLSCTWFAHFLAFVSYFMPIILFNTTSNSKDDAMLNKMEKKNKSKNEKRGWQTVYINKIGSRRTTIFQIVSKIIFLYAKLVTFNL